jgi:hypothetical protein
VEKEQVMEEELEMVRVRALMEEVVAVAVAEPVRARELVSI